MPNVKLYLNPDHSHSIRDLLEGKWYVVATNFPMWLDGKDTNPVFTYSGFRTEKSELLFDDVVTYKKSGKEKKITGTDRQKGDEMAFLWKGKGLLGLIKSKWRVLVSDPDRHWIVISSEKTMVSPAGVDVLCRKQRMTEKEIKAIIALIDPKYGKKRMIQLLRTC